LTRLVLSPDAFIRFRNGEVVIHNAHSGRPALAGRDPVLVAFVAQFASPIDIEEMRGRLKPESWEQTAKVIERLREMEVLIPAEIPAMSRESALEVALAQRQLGLLADATHALAVDLAALGSSAVTYLSRTTGVSLESRLTSLLAAVDSLRTSFAPLQREMIAEQLRRVNVDESARALKLHIGAGGHHLEGWINIDVDAGDVTINVANGLPFAGGSASFIFASHVLEHLYYPEQSLHFLAHCLRVLAPGGVLRLVVPDIEQCIRAYADGDGEFFASRAATWQDWPKGRTPLEDFLAYAGAGPRPGAFLESHKYGYDFTTLERALRTVGFAEVTRSAFMQSAHPELRIDEASAVAGATHGEEHYSLFVEARKSRAA
jgi:SAM-dependent methyltransferase